MDIPLLIRQRLTELGLDQKDLAASIQVTQSYISQLLARKKTPPAPGRTDIYDRIGQFLSLPSGELSRLADVQRREELKRKIEAPPAPLFQECRDLILRKCHPERRKEVRRIFEKETFGELERLVTQKILDVAQAIARDELPGDEWLRLVAQAGARTIEQTRATVLEFLGISVFHMSTEGCVAFLAPMIDSWDIDLKTFAIEIRLNPRLSPAALKRFEFTERRPDLPLGLEPGLGQFLNDKLLSADATAAEIEFLRRLDLGGRRPSPLYYYRELQNLRDPLHFPAPKNR